MAHRGAGAVAHTYDRARYHLLFFGDRLLVVMDPDWTQPRTIHFTVPGPWRSAAELAFPGARWHLCFEFLPPHPVTPAGTGRRFTLDPLALDRWTVGFCPAGSLNGWRWKVRPTPRGTPDPKSFQRLKP